MDDALPVFIIVEFLCFAHMSLQLELWLVMLQEYGYQLPIGAEIT